MVLFGEYASPLGRMLLRGDGDALTGLWFEGQKYAPTMEGPLGTLPVFDETVRWLDDYFSGRVPDFMPRLRLDGTPFRQKVWAALQKISFGATTTYGALAEVVARELNVPTMSAQAVGGAVGHNPVVILVPCHRVLGSDGNLTGYAGGLDRKIRLLEIEGRRTSV